MTLQKLTAYLNLKFSVIKPYNMINMMTTKS